jgi:glycosyltransferase involved in cell wall biosynthesis
VVSDVAIVHDFLIQLGGAERVALQMARIWPNAPFYTSLYRPELTLPEFSELDVRTSILDRAPVDKSFRALVPFYPLAFRSLGVLDHELVISSSAGLAHGVRTAPESVHVVYCYAPARWLYEPDSYLGSPRKRVLLAPMLASLRRWDQGAARRADAYIGISENVRDRIKLVYGLDSSVVYPPVDTARFRPSERGDRLLVVSRLLPYKRVDLAIRAAASLGLGLDVVGIGPELDGLRELAGPEVTFHGAVTDEVVRELTQRCRALCVPGAEDFGIAAIEANAAGKPVIAFGHRGASETVIDGTTGVLYWDQTPTALAEAIRHADELAVDPAQLAEYAERFSVDAFRVNLTSELDRILDKRRNGESRDSA